MRGSTIALLALLALGLTLRLWQIGDVPFGFHPDEAHNGLDAWRIASEGWRPVFLERNNGREPLFMYFMSVPLAILGPSITSARLAGALAGGMAIVAVHALVGSLPLARPKRVALLGAGFLALSFWPLAQSRYALRAILLPVWVALSLWAWWRAVDTSGSWAKSAPDGDDGRAVAGDSGNGGHPAMPGANDNPRRTWWFPARRSAILWAALSGMFIGLAVHTHLTGRVLLVILAASAIWRLVRDHRADLLLPFVIAGVTSLMLSWPQIRYFRAHPDMLRYRADQVSVLNPEVNEGDLGGALADNFVSLLQTPLIEGDRSWYHNIKDRPVWPEPPAMVAFLVGLGVVIRLLVGRVGRRSQHAAVLMAVALAVTTAPSFLSIGAPNYVRLTATWPVLFLLPALGLDAVMAGVERTPRVPRWSGLALALITMGWVGVQSARDYFRIYAAEPAVSEAFNAAAAERGHRVASLSAREPVYVTPTLWNQSVIRFLTLQSPPRGEFDPGAGLRLPPLHRGDEGTRDRVVARYLFDPADVKDAAEFGARWQGMLRRDYEGSAGGLSLIAFELSSEAASRIVSAISQRQQPEVFGQAIRLVGAEVVFSERGKDARLVGTDAAGEGTEPGVARAYGETSRGTRPTVVEVRLLWEALAPTPSDRNLFVHVLRLSDGHSVAQFDGPPMAGTYPTDRWQPGERVLRVIPLKLEEGIPAEGMRVLVGWYDWRDGTRLPVEGGEGGAVELHRKDG